MYYNKQTPLELSKLCCNVIVKNTYSKNKSLFIYNLKKMELPEILFDMILNRYDVIQFILKK